MSIYTYSGQILTVGGLIADGPNCCCCITLGCCCVPTTLHLTTANSAGCGCADGQVITLTYDAANPGLFRWIGTATICGTAVDVIFSYTTSSGTPCLVTWQLTIRQGITIYLGAFAFNQPCTPFSASFPGASLSLCGTVNVTVTQ